MTKARILANLISDNAELADGQISVAEVVGAAPLASPTFTGTASGTFSGPLTGNVTGDVTGNITGNVTGDVVGELDLSALAATISDTAVDVFVYDTSKDSDGGAWRKRTQNTSWYNETLNTATRGSRKEFPSVAVIVAESNQVTIYDGDDPDLPMWFVFDDIDAVAGAGSVCKAITALNGSIIISRNNTGFGLEYRGGIIEMAFVSDRMRWLRGNAVSSWYVATPLTDRMANDAPDGSGVTLVNGQTNDVAMTVLPNAPIDAATGLPVPTIAVATDGGPSIIRDDGTVVSDSTGDVDFIGFDAEDNLRWTAESHTIFWTPKSAYLSGADLSTSSLVTRIRSSDFTIPAFGGNVGNNSFITYDHYVAGKTKTKIGPVGDALGIVSAKNTDVQTSWDVSYITSTYNTGWMNGDIKLATLSDTDDTDVTGSELVTNGTFDSDVSGWTSQLGAVLTHTGSAIQVQSVGSNSLAYQEITADLSKEYVLTADLVSGSGLISIGGAFYSFTNGKLYATLPAGRSNNKLDLAPSTSTTAVFDNISVRLAEEDRSVNGNGLQVFGTVTKTPVATGADLVAYPDFSDATNYLFQPPNADMDFGTGDFSVMLWHYYENATLNDTIYFASGRSSEYSWQVGAAGSDSSYLWIIGGGINARSAANSVIEQAWTHLTFVRRNGVTEIWVNGVLIETDTDSTDLNSNLGIEMPLSTACGDGNDLLALLRISATAPSPEQIAKIYRDEAPLFQDNAQATLYGTSDAVTALAYDDSTELLHVGTSAGRSDFQGLRRVNNTTNAVGAAISASNGMIVEE